MDENTKKINSAPLPFQGQKRMFVSLFRAVLEELKEKKDIKIIVDLFGGSGLLSRNAKNIFPECKVIYNDFDNYHDRLLNVKQTNKLLADIRVILGDFPHGTRLTPEYHKQILERIVKEDKAGFVDYITISSSLLFSSNYVTNVKKLQSATLYNKIIKSDYTFDPNEYLEGLEIVQQDYLDLFNLYKDVPGVLFLVDPPYLSTDTKTYKSDKYWKLKDYLDVFKVLKGTNYFFFTSQKSSLLELCEWLEENKDFNNPFVNSKVNMRRNVPSRSSSYIDIMFYKFGA